MKDLIYADSKEIRDVIKKKYPDVEITNASDEIHTERIEIRIKQEDDEEYFKFLIYVGLACVSLKFRFAYQDNPSKVKKLIKGNSFYKSLNK